MPDDPSDTATFRSSNQTSISISAAIEVGGIVFNPDANTFVITCAPALDLAISGPGITNNSNVMQTLIADVDVAGTRGTISFHNEATAGNLITFVNRGGFGLQEGHLIFFDASTAEGAIAINEGSPYSGEGGRTVFYDAATAGTGTFISNGVTGYGTGGTTQFSNFASADSATFIVNGVPGQDQGSGGALLFFDTSTAAGASLIANGGESINNAGGSIVFFDDSTGGTARVTLHGNGEMGIGGHSKPGLTIGSLEGNGIVSLGGNNLTIGTDNRSTTFAGTIGSLDGSPDAGSLTKVGLGTLFFSGANRSSGVTTVDGGRLLLVENDAFWSYPSAVVVNNPGSVFGGVGAIGAPITINAGGALLAGNPAGPSGALNVGSTTLNSGAIIQIVIGPAGAHSVLNLNSQAFAFADPQAFDLINLGAQPGVYPGIVTNLSDPGTTASWYITTPGFAGTFTYNAGHIDLNVSAAPTPSSLGNISTRLRVGTGDDALIGGFIVTGTQQKRVIVRAIGPSLASIFPDVLGDPVLELRDSFGGLVMSNDNWRSSQEQEIINSGVAPGNDLESAIVATLPANGSGYTAIVRGVNDATGVAVVEVYDLDQSVDSKLADISTRGLVQTAKDVMIAGTIVVASGWQRVLVRAIGPSLPVDGSLADPTLELRDGNGNLIRANDNWRSDQEQEIIATNIPPTSDLESAIVETLPADGAAYTAIVRGANDTTGVALVEVYALN